MVLRADAQRNLERVLDAATQVFAASGPDASIDEIASAAGVGHATVFRRFPTKESLMAAVVEKRVAEILELAVQAVVAPDPGKAFFDFAWQVAELQASSRGLSRCFVECADVPAKRDVERLAAKVVARAQKAGVVRNDIKPADALELIRAALLSAPEKQWRRYVEVVLDGLRVR
jgi:AcrR family transcriptional regulator